MTDAEKREKAIRGLEAHANPKTCETCAGEYCPYYDRGGSYTAVTCSSFLAADALALLKEQEARVMTLEEAENRIGDYIHIEIKGKNVGEYRMLGELDSYSRKYRYLYVLHPGKTHSTPYSYNTINKEWRPWSAHPTEEQMRDTPWEGEKE